MLWTDGETQKELEKKSVLTLKISFLSWNRLIEFLEVTAQKGDKIWSWWNASSRCSKSFISIALYLTESPSASFSFPTVISFWLIGIQFSSSLWSFYVSDDNFHHHNGQPFWELNAGHMHLPKKHMLKYSATGIYVILITAILFPVLCCQWNFLRHVVWL